jgi:hypothetical protein
MQAHPALVLNADFRPRASELLAAKRAFPPSYLHERGSTSCTGTRRSSRKWSAAKVHRDRAIQRQQICPPVAQRKSSALRTRVMRRFDSCREVQHWMVLLNGRQAVPKTVVT